MNVDFQPSIVITDHNLTEFVAKSRTDCAIACNFNELCNSYNFCHGKICRLHWKTIESSCSGVRSEDGNCVYLGVHKQNLEFVLTQF